MARRIIFIVVMALLAGCSGGGAVVFAPTPAPPDRSPLRYQHPSGAFSVSVPRQWSLYEQHTSELAAASFAPPGAHEPALTFAAINLGSEIDAAAFGGLIDQYQSQVRSDVEVYTEQSREAMGDGSWRLTGMRNGPDGLGIPVNTFIERAGTLFGVIEVTLGGPAGLADLQTIVNTFQLGTAEALQTANLAALNSAKSSSLGILHVAAWTTEAGVFFITGEVANYGTTPVDRVPVQAALHTADNLQVAFAEDTIMGHGIPPGGFAPFSLRFGQGQPSLAVDYRLTVGAGWQPDTSVRLIGQEALSWTDSFDYDVFGRLIIGGTVTNNGGASVEALRAAVTVFDGAQNVIAAGFSDLDPGTLAPGESAPFEILLPDVGGTPANYIVNIQGLPG
jgi:hypothetical protein